MNTNNAAHMPGRGNAGHLWNVRYWMGAAREASRHYVQARREYHAATGKVRSALWASARRARDRRSVFMAEARATIAKAQGGAA